MKDIHPIGVVVRRTGLTDHVIRAWERRYGAITPNRSEGNQRLYSDDDIRRLTLLSKAVENGSSIGRIAQLSIGELRDLVGADEEQKAPHFASQNAVGDIGSAVSGALAYIDDINRDGLQKVLSSWMINYGILPVIEQIVPQLMHEIGKRWRDGRYRIHQEHMASEVVRGFLSGALDGMNNAVGSHVAITATPPGDMHDIGSLLCALAAVSEGFEVLHLGANVPFPEIIHLSHQRKTSVIMLSIIYAAKDRRLVQGLQSLREMIEPETRLFIGGRSSDWYIEQAAGSDIDHIPSITVLRDKLSGVQADLIL